MRVVITYKYIKRHYQVYLLLVLVTLWSVNYLTAQDVQSRATRQSSLEAFSGGNYEQAYREFSELLVTYPKDPIYKYYSGVCLVKLKKNPERAVSLLTQAQQGSAIVRNIPPDAIFWLGRAQQMSGKFKDAIDSYNSFIDINGRKESRELGIPDFIQQCEKGEGLPGPDIFIAEEEEAEKVTKTEIEGKDIIEIPGEIVQKDIIVPYPEETLSDDYDKMLSEALVYQHKADSLFGIAEEQKKSLETGTYIERTKLKSEITDIENLASSFQDLADKKYDEALAAMNSKPFTGKLIDEQAVPRVPDTSFKTVELRDSVIITPDTSETIDTITVIADTISIEPVLLKDDKKVIADTISEDTKKADDAPEPAKKVEVFSLFEIKQGAGGKTIPIDPELPEGLLYRIQVAVFRNPVAPSYFRGLTPVFGFKMQGRDLTIYYTGMFRRLSDANKALGVVRKKGFSDAFVSAFFDGKAVSRERAAALEKEWGRIPLSAVQKEEKEPADTVPPALTLRVEIARSQEPLKDKEVDDFRRLSGARSFEIITLPDGDIVYLIGAFITWESAEEYTDLLKRNGYTEAKIGAWLGKREIPVETARELFEMLE